MIFDVIVAVDRERGIARGGEMPWHLPGDLRWFERHTRGSGDPPNTVIMGRRTWESIPGRFRPLPGRRNVVVTRRDDYDAAGGETAPSFEAALERGHAGRVWVAGGAQIYARALQDARCASVWVTEIDGAFDCDTYFPPLDGFALHAVHGEGEDGGLRYRFCEYRRKP